MIEVEPGSGRSSRMATLFRPGPYAHALGEVVGVLRRNRALTREMTKRELTSQYAGSTLGSFWGFAQPLFLLLVYAFIFGVVFSVKIGGTFELPLDYTTYLLAGLVPWTAFQVSMAKSASLIVGNANIVKQVTFELAVLPVSSALAACLPLLLGLGFEFLYTLARHGSLPWTYVLLPVVVALQLLAMVGFAFALSALGAFLRDVRELVQLFGLIAIFILPIVYLPMNVPSAFQPLIWINPFTYMIWAYQDVLYFGRIEHPWAWLVFAAWSLFAFVAGYRFFRKVRPFFGDVL